VGGKNRWGKLIVHRIAKCWAGMRRVTRESVKYTGRLRRLSHLVVDSLRVDE
jgi:hypothetical protein